MSVCAARKKNKFKDTNFVFLKDFLTLFLPSARQSSLNLKAEKLTGTERSSVSPCLFSCLLFPGIVGLRWVRGAFTPANRDVCTWPGGLGLIGRTVWLLPPSSQQDKKVYFRQVNSPPLPPCYTQRGLNHSDDFACPFFNALFPVVCQSTERLLGSMFVAFLSTKSGFNIFSWPILSSICPTVFLWGYMLCAYWFKAALNVFAGIFRQRRIW